MSANPLLGRHRRALGTEHKLWQQSTNRQVTHGEPVGSHAGNVHKNTAWLTAMIS